MSRAPAWGGSHFTVICLELPDGGCPAGDFLDSLDDAERRKVDVLFDRICGHGKITNPEHFKKVGDADGIFEFKRGQIRIFSCFGPNKRVVLLFGLRKKQDKHKRSDIERAELYRKMYMHTGGQ